MTKKNQHDEAQRLYLEGKLSQKEIAERIGISERTMSKWVNTEKWEEMKFAILESKTESLKMMHQQLHNILLSINNRDEGKRFPSKAEADVISQLRESIDKMQSQTSITDIVNVGIEICDFIKKFSMDDARKTSKYINDFLALKLTE
ncbi:MAG: phage terminase small subunit-related protein [Bacteroidales bacterium]